MKKGKSLIQEGRFPISDQNKGDLPFQIREISLLSKIGDLPFCDRMEIPFFLERAISLISFEKRDLPSQIGNLPFFIIGHYWFFILICVFRLDLIITTHFQPGPNELSGAFGTMFETLTMFVMASEARADHTSERIGGRTDRQTWRAG
jgi:hypothetical protein